MQSSTFIAHSNLSFFHFIFGLGMPNAEQNMTAVSDGVIIVQLDGIDLVKWGTAKCMQKEWVKEGVGVLK